MARTPHFNWIKRSLQGLTKTSASTVLIDAFWESLRQAVIVRATAAKVPEQLYSSLLKQSARDFVNLIQFGGFTTHGLSQDEEEYYRAVLWRSFLRSFDPACNLFEGYPLSCPHFYHTLHFSVLPREAQNRIIRYLMPGPSKLGLVVGDRLFPKPDSSRTKYPLKRQGKEVETTYFVRSAIKIRLELIPFLTCRAYHPFLSSLQHAGEIDFVGSPESILAFMHDRMQQLHLITKVKLTYRFMATDPTPPTSPWAWRKLTNKLVHTCTGLKEVNMTVDKYFWDRIDWKKHAPDDYCTAMGLIRLPAQSSVTTGESAEIDDSRPTAFLEKIGRLSAAKVRFWIEVEGADTHEKLCFKAALQTRLRSCTAIRPPLAEEEKCTCHTKVLHESCVWISPEQRASSEVAKEIANRGKEAEQRSKELSQAVHTMSLNKRSSQRVDILANRRGLLSARGTKRKETRRE